MRISDSTGFRSDHSNRITVCCICVAILVLITAVLTTDAECSDSQTFTEGYLEYVISDGAITICGYFGPGGEVTVPSSIAGYPVSVIAGGAFTDSRITVLYLPDTVMEVEEGAIGAGIEFVFDYNVPPAETTEETDAPDSGENSSSAVPSAQEQTQTIPVSENENVTVPDETDAHTDAYETDLDISDDSEQESVQKEVRKKNYVYALIAAAVLSGIAVIVYRKKK